VTGGFEEGFTVDASEATPRFPVWAFPVNLTAFAQLPVGPLSRSVYNRFSQAYLRLPIGEIGGNSTKRPFRLPLDIATRLEKWI
jgi:hypothetical protein